MACCGPRELLRSLSVVLSAAFRGVRINRRRERASAERVRPECKTPARPSFCHRAELGREDATANQVEMLATEERPPVREAADRTAALLQSCRRVTQRGSYSDEDAGRSSRRSPESKGGGGSQVISAGGRIFY